MHVIARTFSTENGRFEEAIQELLSDGYVLLCEPVFCGRHASGYHTFPEFLIVAKKESK